MEFLPILRFLVLLSVLIFVHEGGHFLIARLFGVAVEEFGFGIPPRVWGKKIGGTIYSLNLLPIGGFVRLKGEEGETLGFGGADSFVVQSKLKRAGIVAAGALGNLFLAWMAFSLLWGIGKTVPAGKVLVNEVSLGSPAYSAGISAGDYIVSLDGEKVETAEELLDLTKANLGRLVTLGFEREGAFGAVSVIPRSSPPEGEGPLGIGITTAVKEEKASFWQAPWFGLRETFQTVSLMIKGLGNTVADLFRGEEVMVGGPIAIYAFSRVYADGFKPFIDFMALLSLNLVVVNLLPIPALDGGRILFIGIEALRRKKLSPRTEMAINSAGLAILIVLIVLLSVRDVRTFF
uniref:PDZ domain-containing protein n=1 Tax=candidate division WWE3 bacterium TaxID=2053526 RepID=A0A832E0T9_UNCKA